MSESKTIPIVSILLVSIILPFALSYIMGLSGIFNNSILETSHFHYHLDTFLSPISSIHFTTFPHISYYLYILNHSSHKTCFFRRVQTFHYLYDCKKIIMDSYIPYKKKKILWCILLLDREIYLLRWSTTNFLVLSKLIVIFY